MKKKKWILITFSLALIFCFSAVQTIGQAAETDSSNNTATTDKKITVEDLSFDKNTRILTGKTSNTANIYLHSQINHILPNEEGIFSIYIPDGTERDTIEIYDFLVDQTLSFDYDFVNDMILPDSTAETNGVNNTSEATSQSTETTPSSESQAASMSSHQASDEQISSTESSTLGTTSNNVTPDETNKSSGNYLLVILAFVILLAIAGIFFVNHKKQQPKHKKNRSEDE